MVPAWLHNLSWGFLALGALCAVVIAADELKRPQHMWIMNIVWPVTALFGTIWIIWQYFTYGRSPVRAEAHAPLRTRHCIAAPAVRSGTSVPNGWFMPFR
jgi:hypothetical protein